MAFGFQGPISPDGTITGLGDQGLVDYALARTYRILSADRNQMKASCKICGIELKRDTGFKISIACLLPISPKICYVCQTCFLPIKTASETFPLFNPLPSWWKILNRNAAAPGEKPPEASHMEADQIESMIRQRDRITQKTKKERRRG